MQRITDHEQTTTQQCLQTTVQQDTNTQSTRELLVKYIYTFQILQYPANIYSS
jgi:hypothetical protein